MYAVTEVSDEEEEQESECEGAINPPEPAERKPWAGVWYDTHWCSWDKEAHGEWYNDKGNPWTRDWYKRHWEQDQSSNERGQVARRSIDGEPQDDNKVGSSNDKLGAPPINKLKFSLLQVHKDQVLHRHVCQQCNQIPIEGAIVARVDLIFE